MNKMDSDVLLESGNRWINVSDCRVSVDISNEIILTFDIDWADDAILNDCIDIVDQAGAPATWFITHKTPLLDRLRENEKYELAIHPNFTPLLEGKSNGVEKVIDDLLEIVPEAKSIRSHSLVQSSRLMDLFQSKGLLFDCNHFIPEQSGIMLKPWQQWNGMVKVPHMWEDDAACIYETNTPVTDLVKRQGLKVFDFHPIHVFLNTEDLERYERTRKLHAKSEELVEHRFTGIGTRTHLIKLLELFKHV
jgi:hypothetical protein